MSKYIVTGASGGIGQEIVNLLIKDGVSQDHIVGIYNDHKPTNCIPYHLDFCHATDQDYWGMSNLFYPEDEINLIHCAGIIINRSFQNFSFREIEEQFEVNVFGSIKLSQVFWPCMKKVHYGRLIFISSVVVNRPVFGTFGYVSSKAAISGIVRELAIEGAKYNICTGNIACGYADTGMIKSVPMKVREEIKKSIPLNRLVTVHEIYNTIDFIIKTPYITGQTIHLNGGLYYG